MAAEQENDMKETVYITSEGKLSLECRNKHCDNTEEFKAKEITTSLLGWDKVQESLETLAKDDRKWGSDGVCKCCVREFGDHVLG